MGRDKGSSRRTKPLLIISPLPLKEGKKKEESKRSEASLIYPSPSPLKERGIKGVR